MKKPFFNIILAAVGMIMAACSQDSTISSEQNQPQSYTYSLQLDAVINGFGQGTTRSTYTWTNGTQIYLQFHVGENCIQGTAKYSQATGQWTVTTSQQIAADTDGDCEAYYFVNASGTSSQAITLNTQSIIYQDLEGSFTFTEDQVMSVKVLLSPRTGRVRFKGKASTKFSVSGLSFHTGYNLASNSFTTNSTKLSSAFDKEGDTDYYYVYFTEVNKRQLTVDGIGKGAFIRSFDETVLSVGQSGYITLPAADNIPSGWTLINTDNQKEITLPTISGVDVSKLRSHFATATASVTSLGNGTLSEVGFIYSTSSDPTTTNGTKLACGQLATIEARIASLTAKTTYYIKAYAVNERGTTYGNVAHFTTLSEEEDGTGFGRDEFGEDEDLNDNSSSDGSIGKEGYGDDEDLNNGSSSNGSINKNSFENDENWN
ncbi:MAG: hypothetical protein IJ929_01060 [Prevotella sp.]|nr:hypothetical protein [Prevotella sp.]